MGLADVADGLTRRVRLFERCYLVGFVSYLSDIQCCADHVIEKRFDVLSKVEFRQDIAGALAVLEEHYLDMPDELAVVEPCSAHLSVLGEFWERYYEESGRLYTEGRCNMGKLAASEAVVDCTLESLLRCFSLDWGIIKTISKIQGAIPLLKDSRDLILSMPDEAGVLNESSIALFEIMDKCVQDLTHEVSCEGDFAPLIVSGYLMQEFGYWTREFLAKESYEPLGNMTKLSLAISQLGSLFKKNYMRTVDTLRQIPGYEDFETGAMDGDGNISVSRDLGENMGEDS